MTASGPPTGAIRVLLADGDRLLVRELMRTLSAEERFEIVGCARDGKEAVELATSLLPDVVLMGLEMSALDAVEATRSIRARVPSARVLMMGSFDEARRCGACARRRGGWIRSTELRLGRIGSDDLRACPGIRVRPDRRNSG